MDGTARLQLSAAGSGVSNLGTLDDAAGTVEYDGGGQDVIADDYFNLVVDQSGNKTAQGAINVNGDFTADNSAVYKPSTFGTFVTGATAFNNGAELSFASGASGVFDANGTFSDGVNITFHTSNGGNLRLQQSPNSFGTFTNNGTVRYDGGTQNIVATDYWSLSIREAGVKTAAGNINIDNDLTVTASSIFDISSRTIDVNGVTTINSTLRIGASGVFDADGEFDASSGVVAFTGAGNLNLSNTVTGIGTFTKNTGTVTYDEVDSQTIIDVNYYHLVIDQNATKTAANNLDIDGN